MNKTNQQVAADYLNSHSIPFTAKNNGVHLVVEGKECYIDFWPGTSWWISRCGAIGFGIINLINFIKRGL